MSDQFILILVIIGGSVGLLLVGIAIWMMRSETPAPQSQAQEAPNAAPEAAPPPPGPSEPVPAPPTATDSEPPVSQSETESPSPSTPVAASPSTASTPPPAALSWLNSLTPRPATTSAPPLPGGEELVRLWRSAQGELIVEVGGKRYRTRQELIDAGLEKRVASAANDLDYLLSSPASAAVSATVVAATGPTNAAASPPKPERPVTKVSLEEAAKIEVKPPTMDITKQFRYLRNQQKQPEIQIKTVAEEIDEILQAMIVGTPLAGRGLKVADSPHGASFSIDGRNYEAVDDMPDDDARGVIRAAIQKWDQK